MLPNAINTKQSMMQCNISNIIHRSFSDFIRHVMKHNIINICKYKFVNEFSPHIINKSKLNSCKRQNIVIKEKEDKFNEQIDTKINIVIINAQNV